MYGACAGADAFEMSVSCAGASGKSEGCTSVLPLGKEGYLNTMPKDRRANVANVTTTGTSHREVRLSWACSFSMPGSEDSSSPLTTLYLCMF